jgi:hypothetical protein
MKFAGRVFSMLCRSLFAGCLVPIVFLMLMGGSANAQTGGEGAVSGSVTDQTGAAVPNATVTARNVDTAVVTTRTSSSSGVYEISPLIPGTYTVTVTAKGFEKFIQNNMVIDALHVSGLNVSLKLGSQTESIVVTTAPPALETTNATLGGTIENSVYMELPLLVSGNQQRDITQFSNLLPGAQLNPAGRSSIIGGTEARLGEVYLDGMAMTTISQTGDNRPIFNGVPMEAIEQIQVVTSGFPAEFQGAGLDNYTLKSGTNTYHGTAADYIRNTIFDTWGFSAPWTRVVNGTCVAPAPCYAYNTPNILGHVQKPVDHQNEFTFSVGGPLSIPHLFDARNKLFLHFSYDKAHTRAAPVINADTIPTTAMQGGDFSGLLTANGGPGYVIYDPTSQGTCAANNGGALCRYPFGQVQTGAPNPALATNIIPASEISPIAKNLQKYLPAPSNGNLTGNFLTNIPNGYDNQLFASRLDYDISPRQRLSVAFANGRRHVVPFVSAAANLPVPYINSTTSTVVTTFGDLEYSFTFSPHLVNQFLAGYIYFGGPPAYNPPQGNPLYEASALGIGGLPAGEAASSFPNVSFAGSNAPTAWGGSSASTSKTVAHTYDIVDNLEWVKGRHAITFGIQLQDLMENATITSLGTSTPLTLTYATQETAGINAAGVISSTGFAYASALLGAVDANGAGSAAVQAVPEVGQRFHPIAPYVQDDYKVNTKLTLNIGLRWDYLPGYRESKDRWSFLNATEANPYTGNPGVLQFAGNYGGSSASCGCRTPVNTYWKNWGPRLGFAYAVNSKTVIRASGSILFSHGGPTGGASSLTGTTGFTTPNTITANGAAAGEAPAFYLNNSTYFQTNGIANTTFGGPAGVITVAQPVTSASTALGVGNYLNGTTFVSAGAAPGYADPYYGDRTPTFYFFNGGMQQSITKDITLTVNYAGSISHFLAGNSGIRGLESGQVDPKYLALGPLLTKAANATNIAAAQAIIPGCCNSPYPGFLAAASSTNTTAQGQATIAQGLKWMPQYASTSDTWGLYTANAAYNSVQASVAIRPTHGLTFNINYTWSKEIDDAGTIRSGYPIPAAQNATGKAWKADRMDRSLSTIDSPQNVAAYGVYKLPFGRGGIGASHFLVRALAGGWEFSSILTYSSGYPLTLSSSACTGTTLPNQGTCMPDLNPNFTGPIMAQKWGTGATALNLGTKNYINGGYTATTNGPGGYLTTTLPGDGLNSAGVAVACGSSTSPFCNSASYMIGDAPRTGAYNLRSPGNFRLTSGLRRTFDITAGVKFIFGVDCQNVTNAVTFGLNAGNLQIPTAVNTATFGTLAYASADSRDFQFSGRISF